MTVEDPERRPDFDADLRAVAERRDREAFARLFDHFAPRIKAWLVRAGLPPDRAEDLAQEVMLTVWRRAPTFDPRKATAATWIYTIARNRRIDLLRRHEPESVALDEGEGGEEEFALEMEASDARLMGEQLARAIDSLPPEQAEVLRRFFLEGEAHGEIADALGLPLGTVKSRLRLAVARLRSYFDRSR
jgi:RNA polymerase sigma-70 factor (ECF subfamily)